MRRAFVVAVVLSAACRRPEAQVAAPTPHRALRPAAAHYTLESAQTIRFPFAGETVTPFLIADRDGGFIVSWIERRTSSLNFAALRDGKWFQPRTIARGNLLVNKADFPSIAAGPGGLLFAQWVERYGHGSRIRLARSDDSGATWSAPLTPHPNVESEFGFASLLPLPDGALQTVWLDGRTLEGGEEGRGEMALRSATLTKEGTLSAETLIDPRVCDCCQTGLALAAGGALAVYRDRSADELRDISVAAQTPRGWSPPATIHADAWKLFGCPVNGPRIAADGARRVAVAWFTAAKERPRVQLALSTDGGATFGAPIAIDEGHPAGHVDVALLADGSSLVTWIEEASPSIAHIDARRVTPLGVAEPIVRVGSAPSPSAIGFPRMAVSKDNVAVVWNGDSSVEVAALQLTKR
jgi:hypothetical protein